MGARRPRGQLGERRELTARGHVILRADEQTNLLVAKRGQVGIGLPRGGHVVGGGARETQVVDRRVEQHRRDAAATQQPVVLVR